MTDPNAKNRFPLSLTQSDIWLSQTFHGQSPLFNIGAYFTLDGPVDPDLFCQAHARLLARNDALRIVLHSSKTLPHLSFSDRMPDLEVLDLSGDPDPHARAVRLMRQEFARPYTLYSSPLCRYRLIRAGRDAYYYMMCSHHLIMDGFSYLLMARRLAQNYNDLLMAQNYNDLLMGKTSSDPCPSYADLIQDDLAYQGSQAFEADRTFWAEKTSQPFPPLIPRRYALSFEGQTVPSGFDHVWLPRKFYDQLKAFAASMDGGIFQLITAVLYAYFLKTCDARAFVFGLPVLNRSASGHKEIMGPCVNVLPLRLAFGLDLTPKAFFKQFRGKLKEYLAHQRFPLGRINRLARLHKTGRTQLFDISISYERFFFDDRLGNTPMETTTMYNGFDQNGLSVAIKEFHAAARDVKLEFSYSLGAFTPKEIVFLKERIPWLLQQVMAHPDRSLGDLDLMPPRERTLLVHDFNLPRKPSLSSDLPGNTLVDMFRASARQDVTAPALSFQGQRISYGQLDRESDGLASHLASNLAFQGMAPGSLVGVCMDSCPRMVTAILAIFKAGAVWVPLDPEYPRDRISFMLADADISWVITQSPLPEVLAGRQGLNLILADDPAGFPDPGQVPEQSLPPGPDDTAYVIYTSGTTGQPKGVVCTHKGLANLARAQIQDFRVTQTSRILQFASMSFDAIVIELALTLASGACLVLAPREERLPGPALADLMDAQGITEILLPPSALAVMPYRDLPCLKTLAVGGDACTPALARIWGRGRRILNLYGPTECTVCASSLEIRDPDPSLPLSLGPPLNNVRLYILDKAMSPVPLGVPGELYISGDGVANGYLNRPELTAKRFVKDPFSQEPSLLYRTGDIMRFDTETTMAFMGRKDNQVKVRGFRIELQEIETAMLTFPRIKEAVVILEERALLDRHLTGHFTLDTDAGPDLTAQVRQHLAARLPEHMIPGILVQHHRFPVKVNGKIDRQALAGIRPRTPGPAPASPGLKTLARIFEQTVGNGLSPGPDQDLFEIGMDSLRAVGFLVAVEKAFGQRLGLAQLMANRTLTGLAALLDRAAPEGLPLLIPLQPEGHLPPFFCVTAGYGDLLAFHTLADLMGHDRPFYLLQPPMQTDGRAMDARGLARRYLDQILRISPERPVHLGGYSVGGLLAYELARQMAGHQVLSLVLLGAPFGCPAGIGRLNRFMRRLLPRLFPRPETVRIDAVRILWAMFMDVGLQSHLAALSQYTPEGFSGEIQYFQGTRATSRLWGTHRKWQTPGHKASLHWVPGSHDSFLRPPHVTTLAARLARCLTRKDQSAQGTAP